MSPRSFVPLGLGLGLVALAALAGCSHHPAPGGGETPLLKVSKVVVRDVTDHEEFTGRTDAVETVEIRARATGYLQSVDFKPGKEVKGPRTVDGKEEKGTLLFVIDPELYEASLAKARGEVDYYSAKLTRAKADLQRNAPLVRTGGISRQEYDRYVAEVNESQGGLTAAKASVRSNEINLKFTKVYAPIDGLIGRNLITIGNLVTQDKTHLATIVSQDPMYVYFDVPERTLLKARELIAAGKWKAARSTEDVPVRIALANETGFPHEGKINFVNNQVDAATGTIQLRGELKNPPGKNGERLLTPKLFVRVQVPLGDEHPAVLISDRAVGSDQGQKYVFVVGQGDVVERRVVTLGALHKVSPPGAPSGKGKTQKGRFVTLREVREGLKAGERIVVGGLQRAVPGATVRVDEVEMPGGPPPQAGKP